MESNCLCDLLRIRYPVIQAPMNWVSGAPLVAAVSNAGGLGTLGPNAGAAAIETDVGLTGERLRNQIREAKSLTTKPFAVNIAVGVGSGRQYSQRCVEVAIEESIPVAVVSVGGPDVYTTALKGAGITVLHAVSTARHARKAAEAGVDGVICEGFESGGHKGFTELTTFTLIPMVADAVTIPVVAGGGIADARGVLAAMALGADGVYMGTSFMVTRESSAHITVKDAVVSGDDTCTTSLPKDMMLARDLKNRFTEKYLEMKAAGASPKELREFLNEHSQFHAQAMGDAEGSEICCGQVAGLIKEVVGAAEVIQEMVSAMPSSVNRLTSNITAFL